MADAIQAADTNSDHRVDPSEQKREHRTPLPKLQLFILCYVQLAEPITSTVIYPFVNQLVTQTGITGGDARKNGYYVGLIESIFYLTEALLILQWARASDVIGRKPIMLVGLFGLALSMIAFGVSTKYWMLILSRSVEGLLNGNVGVVKCAMAEITDDSNMAQAFAFLPMVWSTGSTIGSFVGGLLAEPQSLQGVPFFHKYPYVLPCLVAAAFSMSAFLLTLIFLRESAPRVLARKQTEARQASSSDDDSTTTIIAVPLRSILIKRVIAPIACYGFLAFTDTSIQVLQSLMYSTSTEFGGLGFSTMRIGIILAAWGAANGVLQVFAFPSLLKKFGPRTLFMVSWSCFVVTLAMFGVMGLLVKQRGRVDGTVWAVLVIQLLAYLVSYNSLGCVFVCVNRGAPSKEALGMVNGLAQMTASSVRAIAPSAASSLFSVSLEMNLAGGTAVYWIWCAIALGGLVSGAYLPARLSTQEHTSNEDEKPQY